MSDWKSKVILHIKPTQSGKTQQTINRIKDAHTEIGNFFIYFCHNILIAKNQTRARIIQEMSNEEVIYLNEDDTKSEIISFSSEEGDFGTRSEVVEYLLNNDVSGLCLLSHPIRFKKRNGSSDIQGILQSIQNISRIHKVSIYVDEFDNYSEQLIKNIEMFTTFSKVVKVELVSATYVKSKFIKWYGDVPNEQIVDYSKCGCYGENYVTYDYIKQQGNFHSYEYYGDWFDFVMKYILLFQLEKKFYGFVPAPIKRTTHIELVKALNELGISVILYNTDHKSLFMPKEEEKPIDTRFTEQADAIQNIIETYNVKKLIITGNICVGRAVTLMKPEVGLVFDFAIYHEDIASSGDQLYQLDRTKGYIKGVKIPHIVCTKKVENELIKAEKHAFLGISGLSLLEHVNSVKSEMNPIKDSPWKVIMNKECSDRNIANQYLVSNGLNRNNKEKKEGDFLLSSISKKLGVLSYSAVISKLESLKSPTALFDVNNSAPIGTKYSRMIICYKNTSDPSTVCFIVRIIEKVK
jgi:hypothetical protein